MPTNWPEAANGNSTAYHEGTPHTSRLFDSRVFGDLGAHGNADERLSRTSRVCGNLDMYGNADERLSRTSRVSGNLDVYGNACERLSRTSTVSAV